MNGTLQRVRNVTFLLLIAAFACLLAIFNPFARSVGVPFGVVKAVAIGFGVLGLAVVVLTARLEGARLQKACFLLTGASAAAIPVCAVLHNLVYVLFIAWYGQGFWERHGTDEPVFFILALLVFPALFLIGAAGSAIMLVRAGSASMS
jgi:hypothetical protein